MSLTDRRPVESTPARTDRCPVVRLVPTVLDEPPPPRLADLLLGPGRGVLDVLAAPHGIDGSLGGVTLWDPLSGRPCGPDDLLLVAAPSTSTVLACQAVAEAARGGACAVVLKGVEDVSAVRDRARRAGVTVLVAADRVCWDDLCVLARSLVPAARLGQRPGGAAPDLFGLAEATAAAAGGPVEIVDAELRTLAHAGLGHPVDPLRERSVLDRRAPVTARDWFTGSGAAQRLLRSRGPERVLFPGAVPRMMAPVVVRDAVAGYVIVAEGGEPLSATVPDVLTEAAAVVAARLAGSPDPGSRGPGDLADELLRGALSGTGSVEALGRPAEWTLLALRPAGDGPEPAITAPAGACVRMVFPGAALTRSDGAIFVLLPGRRGAEAAQHDAETVRNRLSALHGARFVACVSGRVDADSDVAGLARPLGRAATVLAGRGRPSVASLSDLRPWAVLAELGEIARDRPGLFDGALDASLDHDPDRRAEVLASLLAWFDAGRDVSEAARRLCVHRNTLRYRLQRIEARSGISLDDPVQRFTVELQVRLLALGPATG
ncbi:MULTISPECIES: PucR family transcriptional regulator [Pseudonocardia]|uniref:PucR family transcriptional regulator n=1 Tax=Pseudonocardia TaxID=1847 RepID=UPI000F789B14|nr:MULTISPECIES: PucR family transcriptional regulator [Pseudonocardia]